MKETNDRNVLAAFEKAFDEMGDKSLERIVKAYAVFQNRNKGERPSPLQALARMQFAYRDQSMDHDA